MDGNLHQADVAARDQQGPVRALSPREREILAHLGDGLMVTDIADMLGLSIKTIEAGTMRLRAKVGCSDMASLRRYAVTRRRQELTAHLLSRSVPILNHPILDQEHGELLRLLSRIERDRRDANLLPQAFEELLACARFHIDGEDALLQAVHVPEADAHIAAHRRFIEELEDFRVRLGDDADMVAAFQAFVAHWLGHHIEVFDRPLVAYLARQQDPPLSVPSPVAADDGPPPRIDAEFLDHAIRSHLRWKIRLYAIITEQDAKALDRPRLCSDGHCDLGRWIHGDGRELSRFGSFSALQDAHRHFHRSVGRICDLAAAGDWAEARKELHAGAFYRWSEDVVRLITLLRTALAGR